MKKYVMEFIGTFFIVLTVVMTANNVSIAQMAPLAVAGIYLAMVYVGDRFRVGISTRRLRSPC